MSTPRITVQLLDGQEKLPVFNRIGRFDWEAFPAAGVTICGRGRTQREAASALQTIINNLRSLAGEYSLS